MKGSMKKVFPGSNTAEGFYSYYASGLMGMDRIFVLKGGPGAGKSTLMRKIGLACQERGYDIELWQCSSDTNSLDGVLIPELKVAIVDGTAPHVVDPRYPGVVDEIVNLGAFWDREKLCAAAETIKDLIDECSHAFKESYERLAVAGEREREILALRLSESDEIQLQKLEKNLINEIISKREPEVRHLFSSAITPEGLEKNAFAIAAQMERRYILQGPLGAGQSRVLQSLARAGEKANLALEIYHSPLLPDQVEMVIFPDLKIAAIAAEEIPLDQMKKGDKIISFHNCLRKEKEEEINDLIALRDQMLAEGVSFIAAAHRLHDDLEVPYIAAMDFDKIDETRNQIFNCILAIAAKAEKNP